jgi:hypothetical protein
MRSADGARLPFFVDGDNAVALEPKTATTHGDEYYVNLAA